MTNSPQAYFPDGRPCPDILTEDEAVKYLRLDTIDIKNPGETLRRYRAGGSLRAVQISKAILYPLSELRRFIETLAENNPR